MFSSVIFMLQLLDYNCNLFVTSLSYEEYDWTVHGWYSLYRVVIGYDEGTIMVKLGREVPVASMDSSGKIIWAQHNEIQTVNIKSVGAGFEV